MAASGGGCTTMVYYIANLLALREWYTIFVSLFFGFRTWARNCTGSQDTLDIAIGERLKRFKDLSEKMKVSLEIGKRLHAKNDKQELLLRQHGEFCQNWERSRRF